MRRLPVQVLLRTRIAACRAAAAKGEFIRTRAFCRGAGRRRPGSLPRSTGADRIEVGDSPVGLLRCGLSFPVGEGIAVRSPTDNCRAGLARKRQIDSLAPFAAVKFAPEASRHRGRRSEPAFQMSRAELALGVPLRASAHARAAAAHYRAVVKGRDRFRRRKRLVGRAETQAGILPLFARLRE